MTHVDTPNVGALPRQRNPKLGSIGAIALVIAVGAGIAGGIAVTTDEAPATPVVSHPSTELLERQARSGPAMSTEGATQSQIEEAAKRSHAATKASPSSLPFVD